MESGAEEKEMNPFIKRSRIKPKTRGDREYRDGRTYLQNKTELRQRVFERSGGRCEDMIENMLTVEGFGNVPQYLTCNAPITWESMELSHLRHGIHRDDSERGTIASCKECHRKRHASAKVPRRPGKKMNSKQAKEYFENDMCFCSEGEKIVNKPKFQSFCAECKQKLPKQMLFDLENPDLTRDDAEEVYRELLAECENMILLYDLEHKNA